MELITASGLVSQKNTRITRHSLFLGGNVGTPERCGDRHILDIKLQKVSIMCPKCDQNIAIICPNPKSDQMMSKASKMLPSIWSNFGCLLYGIQKMSNCQENVQTVSKNLDTLRDKRR